MTRSNQTNGTPFESTVEMAEQAMKSAFAKLVRERRKTGESLVIWENNKVCHVPASEIELPDDDISNKS